MTTALVPCCALYSFTNCLNWDYHWCAVGFKKDYSDQKLDLPEVRHRQPLIN